MQPAKGKRKVRDIALDVGYNADSKSAMFYYNSNEGLQDKMINSISNINNLVENYETLFKKDSRQEAIDEGMFI